MSTAWVAAITTDLLERIILDNSNSEELCLFNILHDNGYSTILDGMVLDGTSWGSHKIINFSGLSLRNCNLINIKCNKMLFIKADLSGVIFSGSTRLQDVDFSQAIMHDTYIERPIEGKAIFNDAIMEGAIIVSGRRLIDALSPKQCKEIIHIKIEPELYFNQDVITKLYTNLNPLGVCNGLSLDFAKHIMLKKKTSYIDRLRTMTAKHCADFAKSIYDYQEKLQMFDICVAHETTVKLDGANFLDVLPDNLKKSNILGFTVKAPWGAHIIAITKTADGYIIFDPNMGEIDCSKNSPNDNKKDLNQQIANLYRAYYKKTMAFGGVRISDLEAVIQEVGTSSMRGKLIKKHDMSGLYIGISLFFCSIFALFFDLTDEYTNALTGVLFSVASSFIISVYLASTVSGFYKKHLSTTNYQKL